MEKQFENKWILLYNKRTLNPLYHDYYTQSVMLTRLSVIMTLKNVIMTLIRVKTTVGV
jgi:hypothetical protein